MINYVKHIILCGVLILGVDTQAQNLWSLEECVTTALENNLSVKSADLSIVTTMVDLKQAKAARLPNLSADIGTNLNLGRSIDPTTNDFVNDAFFANRYSVSSGVLLYNGGRIQNSIKQAQINSKSAQYSKEQIERDIALNVATLYLNALLSNENIEIAQNNLTNTEVQRDLLLKQIQVGNRAENEIYTVDAQLASNQQALVSAQNNYTLALLQLRQALLLDEGTPFDIAKVENEITIDSDPDLMSLDELFESAKKSQKSLYAAQQNLEAAIIGEKIAKSQLYPSVTLGGSLGTNYSNKGFSQDGVVQFPVMQDVTVNNIPTTLNYFTNVPNFVETPYTDQISQNLSYGFGLNVNIPIYNNYSTQAGIQRAKINIENSKISQELELQTLRMNVQQALTDAKSAKASYFAAQKSMDAQKLAFENTSKRYAIDAISSFELTNQKALYDNAKLNFLIAKYNYIFSTKVLDFYLGKPIKI